MTDFQENIKKLQIHLKKNPRMAVLCHANPDGDAIGALLGWCMVMADFGVDVTPICYDPVPNMFLYLSSADTVQQDFRPEKYDTIVFLDCGDKRLTKFQEEYPDILTDAFYKINVDHHPTNDLWGDVNFVETKASSTTQILWKVFQALDQVVSPSAATALLTGIYTDTGGFMHQNTTPEVYALSAELMEAGANISEIASSVFHQYDFKTLKLWGRVLQNLHITDDGAAMVGVSEKEYRSIGCDRTDLAGVIDYINSMPEADYSVVLSEDGRGNVKASLRTRKDHVDVKSLAERFGGGGHVKASGFTIPKGKLQKEVRWKIVSDEA